LRLTVVGSTGRTGRHVVEQGLRRGHRITAFTRRPEAIGDASALAGVVAGDGRNAEAVRRAIVGADGVIAIVSADSRAGPHQAAAVGEVLTAVMTEVGVRRLVVTSSYPIVGDKPRFPMWLLRRLLAAAYADAAAMERIVGATELDWTVVRLNKLLDRPATGSVQVSRSLLAKPSPVTRADAAAVLLDAVEDQTLAQSAVNVAGA
jgi:putative NADH-flavin reductase